MPHTLSLLKRVALNHKIYTEHELVNPVAGVGEEVGDGEGETVGLGEKGEGGGEGKKM